MLLWFVVECGFAFYQSLIYVSLLLQMEYQVKNAHMDVETLFDNADSLHMLFDFCKCFLSI